jgi:hypothetical protein
MNSLAHNGFKAWIASEGHKLPVYGVKTEGSTITCWVPSVPDTVSPANHPKKYVIAFFDALSAFKSVSFVS